MRPPKKERNNSSPARISDGVSFGELDQLDVGISIATLLVATMGDGSRVCHWCIACGARRR
jgi:hypothetical protein